MQQKFALAYYAYRLSHGNPTYMYSVADNHFIDPKHDTYLYFCVAA